jgi:hypothetical protein
MAKSQRYVETGEASPPRSFPEVNPHFPQPTHDFTLQAVMEMKESIGQLSAKTDRLIADVKSQSDKVDAIRTKVNLVTCGATVIGFLFALILTLAKLLPVEALIPK